MHTIASQQSFKIIKKYHCIKYMELIAYMEKLTLID